MLDSFSDIAVYAKVVETGSFTAAAERLGVSKAAVSKYVTRLERRLGARLLNRTTRRLSLTEAGKVLFERSSRGLRELEEAEAEVSKLQAAPRGTLRVNAPMSFGIAHIAPALPAFLARYPELTVDVNLDDRRIDLIEEGFDLAIRISDLDDSSLVARRLGPCRHTVCAAPAYLERYGVPQRPADLGHHNVITYRYQESANDWHFLGPDGQESAVSVTGSLILNNSLALREAVLGGAGITRTPTFVVGADIASKRLVPVLTDYRGLELSIYAVYAGRRLVSPKVSAFIDFMAAHISNPPYWDRGIV